MALFARVDCALWNVELIWVKSQKIVQLKLVYSIIDACILCYNYRLVVMFYILPETENCSLEDIESHFSDNNKKITDINIFRSRSNDK